MVTTNPGLFVENYLNNTPMWRTDPFVVEGDYKGYKKEHGLSTEANALSAWNADRANYWNLQQTQWQAAWDLYLRDLNNEYNDPSSQVSRYLKAGINPLWAMSNGDSGNSSFLTSPSGMAANVAPVSFEDIALGQDMIKFSQDNALKSVLGQGELDVKNRNLALQEKLGGSAIDKTKAEINMLKSQLESNEFVNRVNSQTFDAQVNLKIEELNQARATIKNLEASKHFPFL